MAIFCIWVIFSGNCQIEHMHIHVPSLVQFMILDDVNVATYNFIASEETAALTTVFKKSYEYEEIQTTLKPLLDKAFHEPRGMSPKYNTYFPWQVIVHFTLILCIHPVAN